MKHPPEKLAGKAAKVEGSAGDAMIARNPPEPRDGLAGVWDRLVGPGASRAESRLSLSFAAGAAVAMALYAVFGGLHWSLAQIVVAGLLAFDLAGGVVVNATLSARRWYHRGGRGFARHFGFILAHGVQVLAVAWLFRSTDWTYFGAVYGYLVVASLVVLLSPPYLQRPAATALFCGALLLNAYVLSPTAGLEWFVPFLFLKLLVGHLPKEATHRP